MPAPQTKRGRRGILSRRPRRSGSSFGPPDPRHILWQRRSFAFLRQTDVERYFRHTNPRCQQRNLVRFYCGTLSTDGARMDVMYQVAGAVMFARAVRARRALRSGRAARCARGARLAALGARGSWLAALGTGWEAGSPRSVSRSIRGRSCGGDPRGSRRRRGTDERLAAQTALGDPASRPLPWVPRLKGSRRELRRCTVARMATSMAAPLPRQSSPGPRRRGHGGAALRARGGRGGAALRARGGARRHDPRMYATCSAGTQGVSVPA
jgi:hypothetical protein